MCVNSNNSLQEQMDFSLILDHLKRNKKTSTKKHLNQLI